MRARLVMFIAAPIEDVFAFFDDPRNSIQFVDHAKSDVERWEVTEVRPDGRRVFDARMRAGVRTWVQTIDQEVREPPTRLATRSWTWAKDRNDRLQTMTTDRTFHEQNGGTRLDVGVDFRIDNPWRHPLGVVMNRLWRQRAAAIQLEHSLHFIAEHLEARHRRGERSSDIPAR
jgi:uncharacterized protein YndB with AHSA1/START domain